MTATNAIYRRVYVWELPVRAFHWVNGFAVTALAITGWLIGHPTHVELAQEALRPSETNNPTLIATLAAAYAEARRFPEAIETAKQALQVAAAQKRNALANRIRAEIAAYQAAAPYRDTGRPPN